MATAEGGNAEVSTDAGTENSAAEQKPEVTAPEATEPGLEAKPEDPKAKAEADTATELARLQREIKKRDRIASRQHQELELLRSRQNQAAAEPSEGQFDEKQLQAVIEERASATEYARFADKLVSEAEEKFPDFMEELEDLVPHVGPLVQRNGLPSKFMRVVLDTVKKPAEVLHYLGTHDDVAKKLKGLSEYQMAVRLDHIERGLSSAAKPATSNAPKPLEPVKGKASDSDLGPGLSDAEWMKRREAQIREARGR